MERKSGKHEGNIKRLDPPEEERRNYLKTVGALVVGLAVGGAAGWLSKPAERVEVPGVTVTAPGATVTETVTGPAATVTKTVTATITPTPTPPRTLKVVGIVDGSREDMAWGQMHWEALKKLKEDYGADITYADMTPWTEYPKAVSDYLAMGYDIIYGCGYEFAEIMWEIAPKYPDRIFIYTSVTEKPPAECTNVAAIIQQDQESGFVAGVIAGLMTKTNKVGLVLAEDCPPCNAYGHAMDYGLKLVNPDAELVVVYAGTWVDPAKGRDIVLGLIDLGVDIVSNYADATGVGGMKAADDKGVQWIGIYFDQSVVGPETCVAYTRYEWNEPIGRIYEETARGTFKGPLQIRMGVPEGYIEFVPTKNMPEDIKVAVEEYVHKMKVGSINVPRDESVYVGS